MALNGGTNAKWNKRHIMFSTEPDGGDHVVRVFRKEHAFGPHRWIRRLITCMMFAHGAGCREALAETGNKRRQGVFAKLPALHAAGGGSRTVCHELATL